MDQGLVTVIGMSIAYVASFIGMGLAWWAWKRRVEDDGETDNAGDPIPTGRSHVHDPADETPEDQP